MTVVSTLIIVLHLLTRNEKQLMVFLTENIILPIHRKLAILTSYFNVSLAEIIIAAAVVLSTAYIISQLLLILLKKRKLERLFRALITICAAVSLIYAGFCVLWGIYYYGEDFISKSGLDIEPVTEEQLENATRYFADMLNKYAHEVERNEINVYSASVNQIMEKAPLVFEKIEKEFPCLEGPPIKAKAIHFSRIMSYLDFTGFFFPFTGEANVNIDSPVCLLPSTIAHELSHQRGVAKEQEANFTAVLACMSLEDADYIYSGSMLAYIYLGNALYETEHDAWEKIYLSLDDAVISDFHYNSQYWQQFETPVQEVSNTVYEDFLQSYDQKLGLRSYGACVDLLANYYGGK